MKCDVFKFVIYIKIQTILSVCHFNFANVPSRSAGTFKDFDEKFSDFLPAQRLFYSVLLIPALLFVPALLFGTLE